MATGKFEKEMRRNRSRRKAGRRTFSQQTGISNKTVSAKIRKVKKEHPELTHEQVVGRALGTLRHRKKKKRPLLA